MKVHEPFMDLSPENLEEKQMNLYVCPRANYTSSGPAGVDRTDATAPPATTVSASVRM